MKIFYFKECISILYVLIVTKAVVDNKVMLFTIKSINECLVSSKTKMSLPDGQSGRDDDWRSSFVFKNVTIAVIDNKGTLYIIKPVDKMHNLT